MQTKKRNAENNLLVEYDRGMLRAAFVGLFWTIICHKRRFDKFRLKQLSDKIGINKSGPSQWFSGERPNWTVNTISDIANALDVDLEIRAKDRKTGVTFLPYGVLSSRVQTEAPMATADDGSRGRRTGVPATSAPQGPKDLVA